MGAARKLSGEQRMNDPDEIDANRMVDCARTLAGISAISSPEARAAAVVKLRLLRDLHPMFGEFYVQVIHHLESWE